MRPSSLQTGDAPKLLEAVKMMEHVFKAGREREIMEAVDLAELGRTPALDQSLSFPQHSLVLLYLGAHQHLFFQSAWQTRIKVRMEAAPGGWPHHRVLRF
jgi:hypothetical protein